MSNLALDLSDRTSPKLSNLPPEALTPIEGLDVSGTTFDSRLGLQAPQMHEAPAPASATSSRRNTIRIPHITVHAFCDSPNAADALRAAANDRLMHRTHVSVHDGGTTAAIDLYRRTNSPNLIIIESQKPGHAILSELDRLSELCEPGTKVMVLGSINDISFFRELMSRGVSEYLLLPATPLTIIASVSKLFGAETPEKIGQVYAFVGARGGVGSSTIAQNIGWLVARSCRSDTVLADMDMPFGTGSLNLNLSATSGVAQAIASNSDLDGVLFDRLLTKYSDNFSLLSAPATLDTFQDSDGITTEALLNVAETTVPFTILDMPHVWTSWAKNTLLAADQIVITATPDIVSVRNTQALMAYLTRERPHDPPPKLILNKVGTPKRPELTLKEFVSAVGHEPITSVAFDARVFGASENDGRPVAEAFPRSAPTKALIRATCALVDNKTSKQRGGVGLGLKPLLQALTGTAPR